MARSYRYSMTQTNPWVWDEWTQDQDYVSMAEAGRLDLYAFATYILGYDKLQKDIHQPWCEWGTNFSQLRRVRLEPRETYKSTVLTIALSLWLLIQEGPVVRGIEGKNLRILIANAVQSKAMDFAREIDGHIRKNALFIKCYGDLYNHGQWTGSQKTIATRTINRKEPSIQAVGKGGQLTSAHYDVALIDDIVNERDRESLGERERTKRWVKDLLSLVHPDGLIQFLGTRWHYEDAYQWIMEEVNVDLEVGGEDPYEVVSEGCYLEDGVTARFPSILDEKKLNRLRIEKGSFEFASQYKNEPFPPEAQVFRETELQYFDMEEMPEERLLEYFGYCDPALGKSETACFSSVLTVARNRETGDQYLVGANLRQCDTEDLENDVLASFKLYRYKKFGFECNGFQDETRKNIEKRLKKDYEPFALTQIINSGDKIQRIQSAEPVIKAIRYRRDWRTAYPEFFRELTQFPNGDFVDGPDGLEGLIQTQRKGNVDAKKMGKSNRRAQRQGMAASVLHNDF